MFSSGLTTTSQRVGASGRGVITSPRPRAVAVPPIRKKVTSEPSEAASV